MPIYDRRCDACGELILDCYEKINFDEVVPCPKCQAATRRALLSGRSNNVISDEIPGGILIRHGLCDPETGEPRRYYSKSEIAAEAKRRGLVNYVEHVGEPGTDKSKHTKRWY